jgi:hypothetical protein
VGKHITLILIRYIYYLKEIKGAAQSREDIKKEIYIYIMEKKNLILI